MFSMPPRPVRMKGEGQVLYFESTYIVRNTDSEVVAYKDHLVEIMKGRGIVNPEALFTLRGLADHPSDKRSGSNLKVLSVKFKNPAVNKEDFSSYKLGEEVDFVLNLGKPIVGVPSDFDPQTRIIYSLTTGKDLPQRAGFNRFDKIYSQYLPQESIDAIFLNFLDEYIPLIKEWGYTQKQSQQA